MTEQEKKEFLELKYIKAERGFWIPKEEERYYQLFDIHAADFSKKMKALDRIHKQMEMN
jgi:hypothetical protein